MYIKNKPYTPENKNVTYNKFSIYEKMLIGGKEKEIPILRLGSKFNLPKETAHNVGRPPCLDR
jgi:hypothetical protein